MTTTSVQLIDRYKILEPIGDGGMATVYKAYDTRLDKEVAVKFIRTDELPSKMLERAIKRFEREAKSLAQLDHPNIIKVIDFGQFRGHPFLVMEYMPGGTLKQSLLGKPIKWQQAVRFLLPIAYALGYSHQKGIIHRDVKPSNILINEIKQPILSDFGIAKAIADETTQDLTATGLIVGTPEYMSPEQAGSKSYDHRVDIYALGIVLYEMITGRKPFTGDTPVAVLIKQSSEVLPPPTQFVPGLPKAVEDVLIKALAKDPSNRYSEMSAFILALDKLLSTTPSANKGYLPQNQQEPASLLLKPASVTLSSKKNNLNCIWIPFSLMLLCGVVIGIGLLWKKIPTSIRASTPTQTNLPEAISGDIAAGVAPSVTLPVELPVTPTITFEPCMSPVAIAQQKGWINPTLTDKFYGGYKIYVPTMSQLPLLWEANGYNNEKLDPLKKQIFEYDTDREMEAGIWLIYVPYHCRSQFGYLGRNTPVPNTKLQESLVINGDFDNGSRYPWEIGERHQPGISFINGFTGKSLCSQQNLKENEPKGWVGFSQQISVEAGKTYKFQAWIKLQDATAFHIHVDMYKNDMYFDWMQLVGPFGQYPDYVANSDWQFIQGEMAIPENVTRIQLGFWHGVVGDEKNVPGGTVCADEIEFGLTADPSLQAIASLAATPADPSSDPGLPDDQISLGEYFSGHADSNGVAGNRVYSHFKTGRIRYTRATADDDIEKILLVCSDATVDITNKFFAIMKPSNDVFPNYASEIIDIPPGCRIDFYVVDTIGLGTNITVFSEVAQ